MLNVFVDHYHSVRHHGSEHLHQRLLSHSWPYSHSVHSDFAILLHSISS